MPDNQIGLAATRRIVQAGGDVRCIYEASVLTDPDRIAETRQFIHAGEGARVAHEVPMKLCLADGHRALFSLTDPIAGGLTSTNILVEHPSLTASLRYAFESIWAVSEPFERALARHTLSPRLRPCRAADGQSEPVSLAEQPADRVRAARCPRADPAPARPAGSSAAGAAPRPRPSRPRRTGGSSGQPWAILS